MLRIAGQTAGPIGLKFCVDSIFFPRAMPGSLDSIYENRLEFERKLEFVTKTQFLSYH